MKGEFKKNAKFEREVPKNKAKNAKFNAPRSEELRGTCSIECAESIDFRTMKGSLQEAIAEAVHESHNAGRTRKIDADSVEHRAALLQYAYAVA